jgi:hypothetical protein
MNRGYTEELSKQKLIEREMMGVVLALGLLTFLGAIFLGTAGVVLAIVIVVMGVIGRVKKWKEMGVNSK